MTTLGIIWFCLIFVLIAGYFVLDGFDLGAGVLSPFVAKTTKRRLLCARASVPYGTATRFGCLLRAVLLSLIHI